MAFLLREKLCWSLVSMMHHLYRCGAYFARLLAAQLRKEPPHRTAAGERAQHVGHGGVGAVLGDEAAQVQPAVAVESGAADLQHVRLLATSPGCSGVGGPRAPCC
jgi:hypothetical protein